MPDLRPYDPARKPEPRPWEGDVRIVQCVPALNMESVYPDGQPVPSGRILRLSPTGIYRCRDVNPDLGLPLDSKDRIVLVDEPATPVDSPPTNPALVPPPGATGAIWLGPEQLGSTGPHLYRTASGVWMMDPRGLGSPNTFCRPILNPEVLR